MCYVNKTRVAVQLAGRMLNPRVLDEGLRSGIFLVRQPNVDNWHAFAQALVAELRRLGAVVVLLDLAKVGADADCPMALDQELHTMLFEVREQISSFEAVTRHAPGGESLSDLIQSIVDLSRSSMVLIFDHASRLRHQPEAHTLKSLKAARDAVNIRIDSNGKFFLIAADSDPGAANELARDPAQAFLGATVLELTALET